MAVLHKILHIFWILLDTEQFEAFTCHKSSIKPQGRGGGGGLFNFPHQKRRLISCGSMMVQWLVHWTSDLPLCCFLRQDTLPNIASLHQVTYCWE